MEHLCPWPQRSCAPWDHRVFLSVNDSANASLPTLPKIVCNLPTHPVDNRSARANSHIRSLAHPSLVARFLNTFVQTCAVPDFLKGLTSRTCWPFREAGIQFLVSTQTFSSFLKFWTIVERVFFFFFKVFISYPAWLVSWHTITLLETLLKLISPGTSDSGS